MLSVSTVAVGVRPVYGRGALGTRCRCAKFFSALSAIFAQLTPLSSLLVVSSRYFALSVNHVWHGSRQIVMLEALSRSSQQRQQLGVFSRFLIRYLSRDPQPYCCHACATRGSRPVGDIVASTELRQTDLKRAHSQRYSTVSMKFRSAELSTEMTPPKAIV